MTYLEGSDGDRHVAGQAGLCLSEPPLRQLLQCGCLSLSLYLETEAVETETRFVDHIAQCSQHGSGHRSTVAELTFLHHTQ
jgi:hypothetical protein